jgi:polyisoprenyl-phosphate glycosyltransferase
VSVDPPRAADAGTGRRRIEVVVPAFNEELCIEELARRLAAMFDRESGYDWSAIIVENGSTDGTWPLLQRVAAADPRFKVVRLARNFHMDGGLTAGLEFVTADACVFMTADLQDPPEAIPAFVRQWEAGHDNVYGLVTQRQGTGPIRRLNSHLFYWLANTLSDGRLTRNASDFRLMDRRLYETLRDMDERNRFMRGLVAWAGFESVGVPVPRPPRFAGESKAYTWPVIGMAIKGIFAHSYKPLRLISVTGLVASLVAVVLLVHNIWRAFVQGVPFAGYGTITSLLLLIFGMLSLMLGVIAEYIGLIYEEVKRRPNFIVKQTVGLDLPRAFRDC